MKVESDFLIIENDRAVIKTIEKSISTYDCLLNLATEIKTLNPNELSHRISNVKLNERFNIHEVFLSEIKKHNCDIILDHKNDLVFNMNSSIQWGFSMQLRYIEDNTIVFNQLTDENQYKLSKDILYRIDSTIDSIFSNYKEDERMVFINEKVNETDIAFCKDSNPSNIQFSFGDLKLECTNNRSVYLKVFCDNEKLINRIYTNVNQIVEIKYDNTFTIYKAKDLLNDYLRDNNKFKQKFLKTNINFLKQVLQSEEGIISVIEETILPKLKKDIDKLTKNDELIVRVKKNKLDKLHKELTIYTQNNPTVIQSHSSVANSISDRKLRIEFIKKEINRLINLYHEEGNFLNKV